MINCNRERVLFNHIQILNIMFDIILEISNAIIIAACLSFFLLKKDVNTVKNYPGYRCIIVGFSLLLMGSILDITDNFPALNNFIIIGDTKVEAFLEKSFGSLLGFIMLARGFYKWLPAVTELHKTKHDLEKTLSELDTLQGILPICSHCKKIRNDNGDWTQVDDVMKNTANINFTHGMCPDCAKKLYPDLN